MRKRIVNMISYIIQDLEQMLSDLASWQVSLKPYRWSRIDEDILELELEVMLLHTSLESSLQEQYLF